MTVPIYALIAIAVGFFLRGPLRLYSGLALLAGPLLLRLGVAGPATDTVEDGWLAATATTGLLLVIGYAVSRVVEARSSGVARKAD